VVHSYDLLMQPPPVVVVPPQPAPAEGAPSGEPAPLPVVPLADPTPPRLDLDAVEQALTARALPRRPDGVWVVTLAAKELELSVMKENGVPIALQLRVPLSDQTRVIDEAVKWALELAPELRLRLLDPQLNSVLTTVTSSVADEFLRQARYAGEFVGVGDAVGATTLAHQQEGITSTTRLTLAVLVFAVVAYLTMVAINDFRASRVPEPEPQGGPPARGQPNPPGE
jgi:hypothetical protein